ncbi:pyruvate-formate lyase [Lachnospiraceae bacterium PF1-21]|uniref:pyruvate formate lyase family protein n=1 Tax=Ohessyouella blattaphilus TaxID=2949333 RepID=UPI00256C5886|nr:pyruvate formate lyase family protein [Lachnospiraceae bacterium OttesenSCG-928-J05]
MVKAERITEMAKELFKEERRKMRLDGWFLAKERAAQSFEKYQELSTEKQCAYSLVEMVKAIPLTISEYSIFVGTQDDSFARSYALINPAFKVEEFSGYCDPLAVFGDIEPSEEITKERIEKVKKFNEQTAYVKELNGVYADAAGDTKEVAYFFEQVTGHLIPDLREVLEIGVKELLKRLDESIAKTEDAIHKDNLEAFKIALSAVLILKERYQALVVEALEGASGERLEQLQEMNKVLERVPEYGASNLREAIQSFLLLWQTMCLEQTPNPFAFSVGNADRIFEPYRAKTQMSREDAAALFKHFLVFFNVADRSWAISQNLIIGGRDLAGKDLTNLTSYALLDAYFDMNLPQPILSVKLHKNTPAELYEELGRFFFTPGLLTPSLFNDDAVFPLLERNGVEKEDLPDYSVAGCQEPLIMGKDNGNTTNSWLNLPKILELTLTGGTSLVTEEKLYDLPETSLAEIKEGFYRNLEPFVDRMVAHANGASVALSNLRVPFLSCFMGGVETGVDVRDPKEQGTKYNGSGCLIHGLSVLADSFVAIRHLLAEEPSMSERLLPALRANFVGYEDLRERLRSYPKFGNHIEEVDREAEEIVNRVSDLLYRKKNYLGNPFRPDYATPSTHLLYGYWVGATPDGRGAREMLNYGVDPFAGEAGEGMGFRILSNMALPFEKMNGGYASHFGIDPKFFREQTNEGKGVEFVRKIINPLFFNSGYTDEIAPFYLYVNVTTPETLRKVLAEPKKYAPSGVYIMRIHGTFVNFLDLSPAIQQDIIRRLDMASTAL